MFAHWCDDIVCTQDNALHFKCTEWLNIPYYTWCLFECFDSEKIHFTYRALNVSSLLNWIHLRLLFVCANSRLNQAKLSNKISGKTKPCQMQPHLTKQLENSVRQRETNAFFDVKRKWLWFLDIMFWESEKMCRKAMIMEKRDKFIFSISIYQKTISHKFRSNGMRKKWFLGDVIFEFNI